MIKFKLIPHKENGSMTSLCIEKEQITTNNMTVLNDPATNKTRFSIALTEQDLKELVESLNSTRPDLLEELFDKSDTKQKLDSLKSQLEEIVVERDKLSDELDNYRDNE